MSNAHPNLVRGGAMIATSLFASGLILVVVSIIIARALGPREFGVYSITTSLQNVVILFSSFSIGSAVAKYVAEYRVRDMAQAVLFARVGLKLVLVISAVTVLVYVALADVIGNRLYDEPAVAMLIPYSALAVFSTALLAVTQGIVQGSYRVGLLSGMQVMAPAVKLALVIVMLPLIGLSAAFLSIFLAQTLVSLAGIHRLGKAGFSVSSKVRAVSPINHSRILLSYALPATLSAFIVIPLFWLGNTLLALKWGFLAVGHFAVGMVFYQALAVLPRSASILLVPTVSAVSVGSLDRAGSITLQSVRTAAVTFFPLFLAVALFSRELVSLLYGSEYDDSVDATLLLAIASYCASLGGMLSAAIAGIGRMWLVLAIDLVWGAVFLGLMFLLTPSFGPEGLGAAFVVSFGVQMANMTLVSKKVFGLETKRVFSIVSMSFAFFAAAFVLVDSGFLVRCLLWALGTSMISLVGRKEFRLVLVRLIRS